jgi:hypothetical protein
VWDLPLKSGNRLLDAVIGGWTISQTFFYHTSFPFSIADVATDTALAANNMSFFGGVAAFGGSSANVLALPISGIPTTCTSLNKPCWTAADFAPSTVFNGSARNAFRGPNFFNSDFSLSKRFKVVGERLGFTVGANAYNVFNHPHFFSPGFNIAGPDITGCSLGVVCASAVPPTSPFGSFAGAAFGRLVQVTGKIDF